MRYDIRYGKAAVQVYRTYGTPLTGVTPVPESPFMGGSNILMAADIEIQVRGQGFLESYTEGDNRRVVATDTMKNFIHAASASNSAPTLEGWLDHVGRAFLDHYPHMEAITMLGSELPYSASTVPATEVKSDIVEVICLSNSTTGMPAARAASMDGFSALKSTAARTTADGFRAMTSFIWLCCWSVLLSALSDFMS